SADRMIADVCGVRAIHPIGSPALVDTFIKRVGGSMGMIGAIASVRYKISIVLQHVEVIVAKDTLNLVLDRVFGFRISDVDRLAFEGFRLPIFWEISHHPLAYLWIASIEGSRFGRKASLGPVHPQAKFQAVLVRFVGDRCKPVGKFLRIGVPIADSPEPARI